MNNAQRHEVYTQKYLSYFGSKRSRCVAPATHIKLTGSEPYSFPSMDPTYPLVPLANFAAAFLTLLTFLTAQLRESWNMGVCMLSAWVFITTLSTGIQTVVWRDNADTSIAPAFCDIGSSSHSPLLVASLIDRICAATRIQIGTLAAMPACTLVITRSLHRIVSYQTVVFNNPREVSSTPRAYNH